MRPSFISSNLVVLGRRGPSEDAGGRLMAKAASTQGGAGSPGHRGSELDGRRRLLRVPWTARRSNQSIVKEISPGISLEGMMLKLKL